MRKSLFEIASLMSQLGGSGGGSLKALLLDYANVATPLVWPNRLAWFALLLPLLALVWAILCAVQALDSLGSNVTDGMSDFFSISFGFYLSLIAALTLAALGTKRALGSA